MKRSIEKPGNILDRALAEIRNTAIPAEQIEEAATRVFHNLGAESAKVVPLPARIQNCDDFRTLFGAYLSSSLTPSRKILLEDHIHECVNCRKALESAKSSSTASAGYSGRRRRADRTPLRVGFAAAAAALLVVAALRTDMVRDFIWPIDVHATAITVEGGLHRFSGADVRSVTAGERIERHQTIRTATDSGAVIELADGSRVEMGPRSQLSLDRVRDGVKIRLDRGNVIVTAAKQGDGHLYVETKDCNVSVVGTVFSVNSGTKGSRVSVIEGQVQVNQGGVSTQAVFPGQQVSTSPAMEPVPVQQEIAWSRDAAILKEMLTFAESITRSIEKIEMRHTSTLVPLVPASTLVFAALPNVSQSVAESYTLFKQRVKENPMLAEWWLPHGKDPNGTSIDEMVARIALVGAYLGPEIILAIPKDLNVESPVLLADVTRPDELIAALKADSALLSQLGVHVDRNLLVIAADDRQIRRTLAFRQQPSLNPFTKTALYRRLEQAYVEGAGWLLAADLQQLVNGEEHLQQAGLNNVQQLIVEQKTGSGGASYRATLGFNSTRQGMAAWLAEPAPMGALEFVTSKAYGVAAVVTKDPALMVDDFLKLLELEPQAVADFEKFQQEHRVDIRYDVAAALGNEFLVAIDGPILPNPSWKIVIEVNDAARLQNAIERSIAELNREAAARQQPGLKLTSETSGGRTFYTATAEKFAAGIHYTFWAGYMIIAPSRALLIEAIQSHDTGNTLARSASFRSQFPADGRDFASGFVYQNFQAVAGSVPVDAVQQAVDALPTLIAVYGAPDRIVMSSKGVLGMNIAALTGLEGMMRATGLPW